MTGYQKGCVRTEPKGGTAQAKQLRGFPVIVSMSAKDPKLTSSRESSMSVLPLEADIHQGDGYVSFVPTGDIPQILVRNIWRYLNDFIGPPLGHYVSAFDNLKCWSLPS